MIDRDTLLVTLSDLHSGGTTALFPDRFAQFSDGSNHVQNSTQQRIYAHFLECAESVLAARKDKRLIIVHNGDAIEGDHHASQQIRPRERSDQIDIHCELIVLFKRLVDFHNGDKLYYTLGTETHTTNAENVIGEKLGAVQDDDDLYVFKELKLDINGKRFWFVHHGPTRGKGANRGNTMRNWLKHIFYDLVAENMEPPHYIITGHVHDPDWGDYIGRLDGQYHKIEGLICPSWQQKTRYGYGVSPFVRGKVGLHHITVAAGGEIGDPVELIMK